MRRPPNKLHVFTGIVYYFAGYAKMMRNFPEHRAIETITKVCVDLRRTLRRQGKMDWAHLKNKKYWGLHRETGRYNGERGYWCDGLSIVGQKSCTSEVCSYASTPRQNAMKRFGQSIIESYYIQREETTKQEK